MKTRLTLNPYHPDTWLFLVAIPLISAFNFYLTYPKLQFNWYYLMRFAIDTAQGYLAWWAVRGFILYLDRRLPYDHGALKRIVVQPITTTFIGLFIIVSTTELLSWIVAGKPAVPKFYTFDLFIISTWFYVINGVYIGLYYYNQLKHLQHARAVETRSRMEGLLVKHGKQETRLAFGEIIGAFVDGDYVAVCTNANRRYYSELSLDKLEEKLPPEDFFRATRKYILHRQTVTGFQVAGQGKIRLSLTQNDFLPAEVMISRLRAPAFRKWFRT